MTGQLARVQCERSRLLLKIGRYQKAGTVKARPVSRSASGIRGTHELATEACAQFWEPLRMGLALLFARPAPRAWTERARAWCSLPGSLTATGYTKPGGAAWIRGSWPKSSGCFLAWGVCASALEAWQPVGLQKRALALGPRTAEPHSASKGLKALHALPAEAGHRREVQLGRLRHCGAGRGFHRFCEEDRSGRFCHRPYISGAAGGPTP